MNNTFGIKGVGEHCWFLKTIDEAHKLRVHIRRAAALRGRQGLGSEQGLVWEQGCACEDVPFELCGTASHHRCVNWPSACAAHPHLCCPPSPVLQQGNRAGGAAHNHARGAPPPAQLRGGEACCRKSLLESFGQPCCALALSSCCALHGQHSLFSVAAGGRRQNGLRTRFVV